MKIPGAAHSTTRFTIYLPDRDRVGNPVPRIEYWVTRACVMLATINGGVTRLAPAQGMWICDNRLVEETTHVVYTLVLNEAFFAHLDRVLNFLSEFAIRTNQHAVALEYDGTMYIIDDFTAAPLAGAGPA
jgi:hypothetical protein